MQALPSSNASRLDFRFQLFGEAGTTVANPLRQGGHDNALLRADLSLGWAGSRRPRPLRDRCGCLSDLLDSLPHRCRHAGRASGLAGQPWGTGSLMEVGYKLSSEEQGPNELVRYAGLAEEHGFGFALISDHFHPWIDRQGQSPFVWSVIGAIAHTTKRLRLGTAVTCPTVRVHPAIVAQAAATATIMMPGRFFLGVGTGENLNEHIVGQGWPATDVRQRRLVEAIQLIRQLWQGGFQSFRGSYYTMENARLYTLPPQAPPLLVAVGGSKSAAIAAEHGDGMIGTEPDKKLLREYRKKAGARRPCYGELTVCWGKDEAKARQMARERWPIQAMDASLAWELPLPAHFEAVA